MILTVTPNPCVDKTVFIDELVPGNKIRSQKFTCIPGGKGTNVSRAVKALGRETVALVIVGGYPGRHVVEMIVQQDGVRCSPVWVEGMTRTITTVLEEPIHRQTAFFEPGPQLSDVERQQVLEIFSAEVQSAGVVTFNGAVQGPELHALYRDCITIAKQAGARTILDSYGPEFAQGLYAVPDLVKPNVAEAEGLLGYPLDTDAARTRALDAFHERGVECVVLSLGAEGALASRGGQRLHARPAAIEEINPVGSGDALVAGLAIGMHEGMALEAMLRLGVAAGTANAMSWDIGHFTREEVKAVAERVQVEGWR